MLIDIEVHMTRSINLSLTDELRLFLNDNSGDGTLYATPSEFVRALIREKKERQEAAALRQAVLEGYEDVSHDRTKAYTGDLRAMLAAFRKQSAH
jgi:antitoxin ParD1/3/4